MGRPCMSGRWMYVERNIYIYGKRKTAEIMEEQYQGITRRNRCELGAGILWKAMEGSCFGD